MTLRAWVLICASTLVVWGCGGEDDDGDVAMDTVEDTAVMDTVEDTAEEVDMADPGVGSISGNVFWNQGEVPDGSLTLALVTEREPTELDPTLTQVIDPATLPASYTFTDVPVGESYYLLAFFDVGRDDAFDAPGLEDYLAVTESSAGLGADGDTLSNINVELR